MSRFQMPTKPKNGFELLRWVIFEPQLLEQLDYQPSPKESWFWPLQIVLSIVIGTCLLWVMGVLFIITIDLPEQFPNLFQTEFLAQWMQHSDVFSRIVFILEKSFSVFLNSLIFGFEIGVIAAGLSIILVIIRGEIEDIIIEIPTFVLGILLACGVISGLIGGYIGGLGSWFYAGIVVGLVIGLVGWLAIKFYDSNFSNKMFDLDSISNRFNQSLADIVASFLFRTIIGSFFGFISGIIGGVGFTLADVFVLVVERVIWIVQQLPLHANWLIAVLVFIAACFAIYFRVPFYLFYLLHGFFFCSFELNPYINDATIRLPLWPVNRKLIRLAQQQPDIAFDFAEFLLARRPYQEVLAVQILHAANGGRWQHHVVELNANVLLSISFPKKEPITGTLEEWIEKEPHIRKLTERIKFYTQCLSLGEKLEFAQQQSDTAFDATAYDLELRQLIAQFNENIKKIDQEESMASKTDCSVSRAFLIAEEKFLPSFAWITILERLQAQLIASQTQLQIGLQKKAFEKFLELLKKFRAQTLLESRKWNHFYLDAIDSWLKVASERLEMLEQQAKLCELITSNIYKSGEALHVEFDQTVFVGRDDLKDLLSFEILTAKQMPLFLIQGQRRVGKTSLLNFLPRLLGPIFKIVPFDLQGLGDRTIEGWLLALRNAINKALGIQEEAVWNPPKEWLQAWDEFREYVADLADDKYFKLVLAFDEYEILHDDIFQRDPQQAARLLGAMRSFSQQQNQVVFLFVGARFFSDLQQPNWNEYFVQVKHLRVDYLKRPDVLHLIQHPTPDFGLVYADDLANRIFDLTQGHPALVQQICSEMVNLANMTNHRQMTHEDLDQVLREKTLFRENLTIQIFWTQFCSSAERATVKQILAGETPTDPVSRSRLELHGYIVKDGDNWKMRVPLFEQWLRKYIETFPA